VSKRESIRISESECESEKGRESERESESEKGRESERESESESVKSESVRGRREGGAERGVEMQ
jgi:hypothetical protein